MPERDERPDGRRELRAGRSSGRPRCSMLGLPDARGSHPKLPVTRRLISSSRSGPCSAETPRPSEAGRRCPGRCDDRSSRSAGRALRPVARPRRLPSCGPPAAPCRRASAGPAAARAERRVARADPEGPSGPKRGRQPEWRPSSADCDVHRGAGDDVDPVGERRVVGVDHPADQAHVVARRRQRRSHAHVDRSRLVANAGRWPSPSHRPRWSAPRRVGAASTRFWPPTKALIRPGRSV